MSRRTVNLGEAKKRLSILVEQAARGEPVVIVKYGSPRAMLVPLPRAEGRRKPAHVLDVTYIAPDFDVPDPGIVALFGGRSRQGDADGLR
jgi:prevent-host-death family protein